jgi:hypothetical protein
LATTAIPDVDVMTPKDFQDACMEAVAMGTLISTLVMLPVNVLGMYTLFIKIDKMFNPHRIAADQRRKLFSNRFANKK